jgi:hypothetical protein
LSIDGYLKNHGYFISSKKGGVYDAKGNPTPWLTYPFLDFFLPRLSKDLIVFEFGLGYSTRYYLERGIQVFGVDHDKKWFEKVNDDIDNNNSFFFHTNKQDYVESINTCNKKFDVVIIDGVFREECALPAVKNLSGVGVVVLDNSERHTSVKDVLQNLGFKGIDFVGLQSLGYKTTTTSIFYKENNCLNI